VTLFHCSYGTKKIKALVFCTCFQNRRVLVLLKMSHIVSFVCVSLGLWVQNFLVFFRFSNRDCSILANLFFVLLVCSYYGTPSPPPSPPPPHTPKDLTLFVYTDIEKADAQRLQLKGSLPRIPKNKMKTLNR